MKNKFKCSNCGSTKLYKDIINYRSSQRIMVSKCLECDKIVTEDDYNNITVREYLQELPTKEFVEEFYDLIAYGISKTKSSNDIKELMIKLLELKYDPDYFNQFIRSK